MRNLRLLVACTAIFAMVFAVSCGDDDGDDQDCGNGVCEAALGETSANCPADCTTTVCNNNNLCEPALGENETNCAADCSTAAVCGNNTCELGENETNCPADCSTASYCGDNTCDADEDATSCPADCGGGSSCDSPTSLINQVGCVAGEMCTVLDAAGTIGCGPEGTAADYAECGGSIGDCLAGAFCGADGATGMCMPYCDLTAGTCPGGGICAYSLTTSAGNVGLCAPPDTCDLVDATGCDAGEGCYLASPAGDTLCITAGTVANGGACTYTNDCGIGAGCSSNVCVQWCKGDGDCDTGTCQNIGQVSTAHTDTGVCQ